MEVFRETLCRNITLCSAHNLVILLISVYKSTIHVLVLIFYPITSFWKNIIILMIHLLRRNCVSSITYLVLSLCVCAKQCIHFEYIWWRHILSDVLKWKTHICHNALIRMTFCSDVQHFFMACYLECRR